MKVGEIAEAIAKLPQDQLTASRRWFNAFEAGRADHAKELDSTATKLGRLAGRAFAELKKPPTNHERHHRPHSMSPFPLSHPRKYTSRSNAGMRSCTLLTTRPTDAQMQHFRISSADGRREYRVNPLND
jgi:hypothetical protein